MYCEHFGLGEKPFSLSPDPRYLFLSESHRANLMDKLDIHKVSGLVRFAIRVGLVTA